MTEILINDDSGKTGFDLINELKSIEKKDRLVPIIVFTELSQEEDRKKAKSLGADYYLIKSEVTIVEVIEKTKRILEGL
jgi:DNA-binding response OmpR family regulator